ncbi:MAG: 2-C-methyl-D-erythritol 4-phosphate cytidylyltransferase [Desulfuromonas sp.]|nr:MAG: 2-C-methyl-D-erythritol 4-phosphate cytidylyltransferase [Desulfuromonas sp.]
MNVHVLIPAAGAGRRMRADVNKQYLSLGSRPILAHTIDLFEQHSAVDSITLIAPEAEIPYCRDDIVARFGFAKIRQIVAGGAERQDSVRNGLRACAADDDDIILIHDGVRPLLPGGLIDSVVAAAVANSAALIAVPAKDTIKVVVDGKVTATPDRSTIWLAQTPQAFRYRLIASAHEKAYNHNYRATDDAQLAEWIGAPVAVVPGSYANLKITTPEDLELAASILQREEDE